MARRKTKKASMHGNVTVYSKSVEELASQRALAQKKQFRRQNRVKRLIFIFAAMILVFLLFGSVTILGLSAWNDFDASKINSASQTMLIYDDQDKLITGVYGTENRQKVSLSKIPKDVQNALISMEDLRFYEHSGIDIRRIFGALWVDFRSGSLDQGASTITQQLIKLSHLTSEKTWIRKIREAVLAIQMEQNFSKDDILEMYLNYVYFGSGAYGIEAAAQEYFNKECSKLTTAESALLVGILKAPSRYAPHLHLEASVKRRNLILSQMRTYGFIDETTYQEGLLEPVELDMRKESNYPHGYYLEVAMKEAREILDIDQEALLSGGYRIYTSLDTSLQKHCELLFSDDTLFPEPINGKRAEASIVIINPKTFQIQALMGGREHEVMLGLNRATQVKRQPGSAIKPLMVYAPAMEKYGYTAASFLMDEPTDFSGYSPRNFGDKYYGWVTMRQAVTSSLNVPAVKVLSDIGVSTGKSFCEKIGIDFDDRDSNLPLALGGFTYGVTPLQLCSAYSSLASGGLYEEPGCVRKIVDSRGQVLYEDIRGVERVMEEDTAFIMTSMLESVINDGTGRRLNIGIPLAGKTGTTGLAETGGNKDVWMVAYNTEHVAAIWMGFDDTNSTYSLPSEATGGTYPAQVLARVFEELYPDKDLAPNFEKPDSVVEVSIDKASLDKQQQIRLSNALTPENETAVEYFTEDTVPKRSTDYWSVPTPPGGLTVEAGVDGKPEIQFSPEERYVLYRLYREEGSSRVLLGEFPGDTGDIFFSDRTAIYNHSYSYFVIPVHPELSISGEQVEGPPSSSVSFTVRMPTIANDNASVAVDSSENETMSDLPESRNNSDPIPSGFAEAPSASPSASASTAVSASPAKTQTPTASMELSPSVSPAAPSPSATPSSPNSTQKPAEKPLNTSPEISPSSSAQSEDIGIPEESSAFELSPEKSSPSPEDDSAFQLY